MKKMKLFEERQCPQVGIELSISSPVFLGPSGSRVALRPPHLD